MSEDDNELFFGLLERIKRIGIRRKEEIDRLRLRVDELEEENNRVSKYAADAEKRVAELERICKEYEDKLFELKKGY